MSTYVILGMGEDPEMTVEGCKRAIDLGVYPFVVPLRPVPGSLMEDLLPAAPRRRWTASTARSCPIWRTHGMSAAGVAARVRPVPGLLGAGAPTSALEEASVTDVLPSRLHVV